VPNDDHHVDAADDHHLVDGTADHDQHDDEHDRDVAERGFPGRAGRPARLSSVTIRAADRRRVLLSAGRPACRQPR